MADPHGFVEGDSGLREDQRREESLQDVGSSSGRSARKQPGFSGELLPADDTMAVEGSMIFEERGAIAVQSWTELPMGSEGEKQEVSSEVFESDRRSLEMSVLGFSDHGMHANLDLQESRSLQLEDGKMSSSFELNRAISTVVGSGTIDRHFVTWGQIDLILAYIPGARNAITISAPSKLKIRDFRKIHTQEALNLNLSSLPRLTKIPKPSHFHSCPTIVTTS